MKIEMTEDEDMDVRGDDDKHDHVARIVKSSALHLMDKEGCRSIDFTRSRRASHMNISKSSPYLP